MTTTKKKPPTQRAGVEGIAAIPIELTPPQPQKIDWARLCELPPFQMFAAECLPELGNAFSTMKSGCGPLWEWNTELKDWMLSHEPEDLYKQYCDWHKAKGYWPNETPMGELIKLEA